MRDDDRRPQPQSPPRVHHRRTFEAGLVLTGTEIKWIRAGKANIANAYARIERARPGSSVPNRAVRAGRPLQPRPETDAEAAPSPARDR